MTTNYLPDPGRIFRSDVHRRVAAHLPLPPEDATTIEDLLARVDADADTPFGEGEDTAALKEIVVSLIGDDLAERVGDDYKLTELGLEKLSGPIAVEPPPLEGPRLEAAEALDKQLEEEEEAGDLLAAKEAVKRAKAELKTAEATLAEQEKS